MSNECPSLLPTLVIGDDPYLLAQISCLLSQSGKYLSLIDGPRMGRPDVDAEVTRRNNAAARLRPKSIFLAGLPESTVKRFEKYFPPKLTHVVTTAADVKTAPLSGAKRGTKGTLFWGKDKVGLGLLSALRSNQEIVFTDEMSPHCIIPSQSGHLIVCEEGNELAQVIAANYAFALGAGLCLIPAVPVQDAEEILEYFYSLYEKSSQSPSSALEQLRCTLRSLAGTLPLAAHRSATFITGELPWGFAFPEIPTTHLFMYPDLGISILNGIVSEQVDTPGIRVAVLVDPGEVEAAEMKPIAKALAQRAVFVRGVSGPAATVYRVSHFSQLFPYDFLLISTHCGDAPGWRWTYEFIDREGNFRNLVIDLTIGIGVVPGDDKLDVVQYTKFVSLDGVDWNDPQKNEKVRVGTAILDYIERTKDHDELQPVRKETVPRVPGSAALKMADGNFIPIPRELAGSGAPIILNNACGSWHRLAKTFTFSNARAYIGTLFSVSDIEAQEVATKLFEKHFGRGLAVALWRIQNEVYGDSVRRPYVLVGPHFQRLRSTALHAPRYIAAHLAQAHHDWASRFEATGSDEDSKRRTIKAYLTFLRDELEGLKKRWGTARKE